MNLLERSECSCGATSEPQTYSVFMYDVYIMDLLYAHMLSLSNLFINNSLKKRDVVKEKELNSLDSIIAAINEKDLKPCPDRGLCSRKSINQKFLQNQPEIFALSLIWDTSNPTPNKLKTTLNYISEKIDLR